MQIPASSLFELVISESPFVPALILDRKPELHTEAEKSHFLRKLSSYFETLTFSVPNWKKYDIPDELQTCTLEWVRVDRVKRLLESPYSGPYEIVKRHKNYLIIRYPSRREDTVSLHKLKLMVQLLFATTSPTKQSKRLVNISKNLSSEDD